MSSGPLSGMGDACSSLTSSSSAPNTLKRRLGGHETFCNSCHGHRGNLNVMCGLTILTRQAIDEGLMKCALQEFQHRYPQLTSRIRTDLSSGALNFIPMECPTFPLDTEFKCRDMLHSKFDTEAGPLWRVQLVTEETMEKAALGFGPEVSAIIEDDSPTSTRWRYFLRYFQGKVNGQNIANFDEEEEGFRSFILLTFHPSITDTIGSFHLTKQFLLILDAILEQDGNNALSSLQGVVPEEEIHSSIESLLPQNESGMQFGDLFQMAKMATSYVIPRRSPFEDLAPSKDKLEERTEMLRGWLSEEQTAELLAMQEEDDASLHGVMLAAGLLAVARVLQTPYGGGSGGQGAHYPPSEVVALRASNETNLRQYCARGAEQQRHGCLTTSYDTDHAVPPITDRADFWRYAHELTVKHNAAKGSREPLKTLRVHNKMGVGNSDYIREAGTKISNEMGVAVYGDVGGLFRREHTSSDSSWSSGKKSGVNVRLEDVFHMVSAPNMSSPVTHTAHVFRGQLNYILLCHTGYLRQELGFRIRDEVVDILRMATERNQ